MKQRKLDAPFPVGEKDGVKFHGCEILQCDLKTPIIQMTVKHQVSLLKSGI